MDTLTRTLDIPAVAGIDAPMDAAEFSAAAEMLFGADWKPRAALLLDVSERSIKRWATGKWNDIPASIGLAMRLHLAAQRAVLGAVKAYEAIERARIDGAGSGFVLDIRTTKHGPGDPVGEAANALFGAVLALTGRPVTIECVDVTATDPIARAVEAATRHE